MTVFVEFISWNRGSCWLQVAAAFMLRKICDFEPVSPISGHLFRRVPLPPLLNQLIPNCEMLVGSFFLAPKHPHFQWLPGLKFLQGFCFRFELLPFGLGRLEKPWHQCSSGQFRCQCSQTLEGYDWNLTSSKTPKSFPTKRYKKHDMSITNRKSMTHHDATDCRCLIGSFSLCLCLGFCFGSSLLRVRVGWNLPFLTLERLRAQAKVVGEDGTIVYVGT